MGYTKQKILNMAETEDDKMSLICYKKGGKWYIGGTVENE